MLVLLTCDCPTACIGPLWPVPCWAQVSLESRKSKSEAKYLHLSLASIWWGLVSSCPTCASAYGNTAVIRKSTVCSLSPQTLNLPQAVSQIPRGMNSVLTPTLLRPDLYTCLVSVTKRSGPWYISLRGSTGVQNVFSLWKHHLIFGSCGRSRTEP